MIVHQITPHHAKKPAPITVSKKAKFNGKQGGLAHQRFILQRAFVNCPFKQWDNVVYKKQNYVISEIYGPEEFDLINFDGLSPLFVEIMDSDGQFSYVNPGSLKKQRS